LHHSVLKPLGFAEHSRHSAKRAPSGSVANDKRPRLTDLFSGSVLARLEISCPMRQLENKDPTNGQAP
jgi:hypothetical protein